MVGRRSSAEQLRAEPITTTRPRALGSLVPAGPAALLHLQRTAGNAAVVALQRDDDEVTPGAAAFKAALQGGRGGRPSGMTGSNQPGPMDHVDHVTTAVGNTAMAGLATAGRKDGLGKDEVAEANLWTAAGAADMVAGPFAFASAIEDWKKSGNGREKTSAILAMLGGATDVAGGAATVANSAFARQGLDEDRDAEKAAKAAGKAGPGKSNMTKIAEGTGWNAPAVVQDWMSAIKGGWETILKFWGAIKSAASKSDSKATTARRFAEAVASLLDTGKSIVSGARYFLLTIGDSAADAVKQLGIPIMGLLANAAHLVVKTFDAVKAFRKRSKMGGEYKSLKAEIVAKAPDLDRYREVRRRETTILNKVTIKSSAPTLSKHGWLANLRARANSSSGPLATLLRRFLTLSMLRKLQRKRFVRAITTMVPKVLGIIGEILNLSGLGAVAGTAVKAASTAWSIGQVGFRWIKQKVANKQGTHKSEKAKLAAYVDVADDLFDRYRDLPQPKKVTGVLSNTNLVVAVQEIERDVKAAGAKPAELYAKKDDIPGAYKLLVGAMKKR